jgi:hypothetical protein
MAHFAELDKDNIVTNIYVVANEVLIDENNVESELKGVSFLKETFRNPNVSYVQTSFNGSFRKRYAGLGYVYDLVRDAFIPPKPFDSWLFDENELNWVAPIQKPEPNPDYIWVWDEITKDWFKLTKPSA